MNGRRAALLASVALLMAGSAAAQSGDSLARALAEDFFAGRFAPMAARFDDRMAQAMPEEKVTDLRVRLVSQVGAFQAITGTRTEDTKGYHIVFVTCRFEKMTLDMKVVFDSSNRVAGLSFLPLPPPVDWSPPPYAKADGSYVIDLRQYHPVEAAARLRVPLLILQGDLDYQCTMKNFEGWKNGLAGRPNVTFKLYPGLTHLFTPASPGRAGLSTPADYDVPQHVAEAVIEDVAAWLRSVRN